MGCAMSGPGRSAQYPPQAPPSLARSSPSGSIWSMSGSSLLGPSWAFPPPDQPYPMSSPQPLQNPFQQQGVQASILQHHGRRPLRGCC